MFVNPLTKETGMEVSELHRFTSSYHGASGWAAEVTIPSGERLVCSRYDSEDKWIADGIYTAATPWFPVFWNGEGSRCTLLKVPSQDIQEALDRAVDRALVVRRAPRVRS